MEDDNIEIITYPNPANNDVNISINYENADDVLIQLINTVGIVTLSKDVGSVNGTINIDLSGQTPGVYILSVQSSEFSAQKIIIK